MDEMRPLSPIVFDPLQARIHRRRRSHWGGTCSLLSRRLFLHGDYSAGCVDHSLRGALLAGIESALRDVLEPVAVEPQAKKARASRAKRRSAMKSWLSSQV
jgi:predicted lipase